MNLVFLGPGENIKMRKGKSLHSSNPYVLKKLSGQDKCIMAHKGGIKSYGDEKAMITEGIFQLSGTEEKSLSALAG